MSKTEAELEAENRVSVEVPKEKVEDKGKVWIACRATENCPGTYAVILDQRTHTPSKMMGAFQIAIGGRFVRYQCCTCHRTFAIST